MKNFKKSLNLYHVCIELRQHILRIFEQTSVHGSIEHMKLIVQDAVIGELQQIRISHNLDSNTYQFVIAFMNSTTEYEFDWFQSFECHKLQEKEAYDALTFWQKIYWILYRYKSTNDELKKHREKFIILPK